ncbi:hypothetical protein OTB20_39205 [Streptomyces sp. H27-H1]|uniref:hypothetical protein n=1 Tax=Streptomyces sp. H27-H1 TaxID=2996461 RepID=UPI00226EC675|nr:hypothetical protein [Streptomyces sp. H27-H1]MCY0932099.1 hypothetical protein [Streptomyces sp. H27-H1]
MDPHGPIARRFPLIARFRPACLPLPERVQSLVALAETAEHTGNQGLASAVFNQAALIAADTGLPQLARTMCHQHAAAYLHACPLPAMTAIRALEPLVNLARLQIRAGREDDGRTRLMRLYNTARTTDTAQFDGITVPAHLTEGPDARREVQAWLWRVLLADGTRTLTTTGRWAEALAHLTAHHGIGRRMLDGRQVAVLAALVQDDKKTAAALLTDTEPGQPWEQAVTASLAALHRQSARRPAARHLDELATTYLDHEAGHGTTVFDIRLGLTVLDILTTACHRACPAVARDLHRRTVRARDGYAARETLAHPLFAALLTDTQIQDCRNLLAVCSLAANTLPPELHTALTDALQRSEAVIRASLPQPNPAPQLPPATAPVPPRRLNRAPAEP